MQLRYTQNLSRDEMLIKKKPNRNLKLKLKIYLIQKRLRFRDHFRKGVFLRSWLNGKLFHILIRGWRISEDMNLTKELKETAKRSPVKFSVFLFSI